VPIRRPADLIDQDRAAMRPPPPASSAAGFTTTARLPRDYYVRVLGSDYSIDPAVIGRTIDVTADLDTVTARCDSVLVARHPRSWARRQTITDLAQVAAAARLRAGYQHARAAGSGPAGDEAGLVRNLADYDARFGIDFGTTSQPGNATTPGPGGEVAV
jgi:hypothetical protein